MKNKIDHINKNGFELFPIGSKVHFNRENIDGIVTEHGWSINSRDTMLIGIKVPGKLGSALLSNRKVFPSELILLD